MSSETRTESAGAGVDAGESGTGGGPRSYGPAPAPGVTDAPPQAGKAQPSGQGAPQGSQGGTRRKGAHTMGPVAYQQPDSAPGTAGPQPPAAGGWTRPGWARRPGGGAPQGQQDRPPQGAPRPQGPSSQAPRGRKARLRVAKVDPWSVMKTTFVLSIAFAIVSVVAAALLWSALNALGVFDSINSTLASVAPANQPNSLTLTTILSFGRVMSFTALVSVVNIVLFTALATLGAYLYNMCSSLVGGVEVTLADDTV